MVLGRFMCFLHGSRDMGMNVIRLGLLILDILTRDIYNSERCIIGRKTIWWKRISTMDPDIMSLICVGRRRASLTSFVRDQMNLLIETRQVRWVPLSNSTGRNNCNNIDLHHRPHAHHCIHHHCHLLLHGLHIAIHLLMYLFYITHYLSLGTSLVWVL